MKIEIEFSPVSSDRSTVTLEFPYPARRFILVRRLITAQLGLHRRVSLFPYFTKINILTRKFVSPLTVN